MKTLIVVLLILGTTACSAYRGSCVVPNVRMDGWPVVQIAKWPELSFRLPPSFHNDSPIGPWFDQRTSQFAIQFHRPSEDPLFARMPAADHRPEYTKCRETIDGMNATIISYNLRESVGDMAFVGPLQFYAEIELRNHSRVLVSGMTDDRRVFNELLTAIRSIRVADALRVRPNTR